MTIGRRKKGKDLNAKPQSTLLRVAMGMENDKEVMMKGVGQREKAASWYRKFHTSDYATLLHLPFSSIVISFLVFGATMAKTIYADRLVLSALGVFFALQGAHYLDEIKGHHWGTKIPDKTLYIVGFTSLAVGALVGIYLALRVNLWILAFVPPLVFFPVVYNLELWEEKFHNTLWFGVSWGGLVCLGSYFLQSSTIDLFSILMSIAIGVNSASILILYEGTKVEKTRALAWNVLKGLVLFWNLLALAMLVLKFV